MVLSFERWQGKVAVVTGASSGIGKAIARKLTEEGMLVVGVARRSDQIDQLAGQLSDAKGKLHSYKADLSKEEDIISALKWANQTLGPIHVLINNAGVHFRDSLVNGNTELWRKTIDVNVLALCIATREAIEIMKRNNIDGHVIHINSIAGHSVPHLPNIDIYSATKFAVTALTETLRLELNYLKSKIRVTSISPGAVDTPIFDDKMRESEAFQTLVGKNILKPEDIADSIFYVLSTPPHVQVHELTIKPVNEFF